MKDDLSQLSLEELWRLFPIKLVPFQKEWANWYDQEFEILNTIIPVPLRLNINHIGSTAIDDIWSKPIIDILIETDSNKHMQILKNILVENGYRCMSEAKNKISLNKGYTKNEYDKRVFHIHLRIEGDNDEIYFRDYLNKNKEIAKKYEKLKLSLWKEYEYDRDAYTDAKSDFVIKYTKIAKEDIEKCCIKEQKQSKQTD